MNRRRFVAAAAAGLAATPRAARAQESAKPWRIGFLEAGAPAANQHFLDAFKRGLSERGYAAGGNVVIVERWGDGQVDRFPALLSELVQEKVDIVVVASTAGAVAAKATIKTLPVVFVGVQDQVGIGIVSSLGCPGACRRWWGERTR
jgi:putative ABC transport system substrate-binding protein